MIEQSSLRKMKLILKEFFRRYLILQILKFVRNTIRNMLYKYDIIFCDITNVCNLRCPHCYNNWGDEYLQKKLLMSKDHFEKILKLAPLTSRGNYLISCAFEPTLHPNFLEMLQTIPVHHQKKMAFTTNLATDISDSIFVTLSKMRLHHINISIESFNPEVYEICRRNAHYDRFINNLDRLSYYFNKESKSPPIRFITLVTRLNSQEIPDLIRRCHTQYQTFENEIRYPWTVPGPWNTPGSIDWIAKHALTKSEWDSLVASLVNIPFRYRVSHPQEEPSNGQSKLRILWIRPDGLLLTTRRNVSNTYHLDSIEKLHKVFGKRK